jgi:hypothetical protein
MKIIFTALCYAKLVARVERVHFAALDDVDSAGVGRRRRRPGLGGGHLLRLQSAFNFQISLFV